MAAPTKKRATEEVDMSEDDVLESADDDDDEDMQSDEASKIEAINEQVQVEFEARSPEDPDFHGVKGLLQQLFLKANINLSEMTNTLLSQNYIGSVIKQSDIPEDDEVDSDDDDPVFGITSIINLTHRQELECVKQLKLMVTEKCQENSPKQAERLAAILSDPDRHVGFLINERFINIPPQISLPMLQSLRKEMDKATNKNMEYKFDWYLLISKTYREKPTKQQKSKGEQGRLCFTNEEEKYLVKHASLMFDYSVSHERDGVVEGGWDAEHDMDASRTVFLFTDEKLNTFITELQAEMQ